MRTTSILLILQFLLYAPLSFAKTENTIQTKKIVPFALVKMLRHELDTNQEVYFNQDDITRKADRIDEQVTDEIVADILDQLKDSSYSFKEIKAKINQSLIREEQERLIELKYLLSKAPTGKLDQFFKQAMQDGMYQGDYQFYYDSAYNKLEKIEVLMQMLNSDFSLIRSQNAKHLGMMNRDQLIKHVEKTGRLSLHKNNRALKAVIIVLTIAAAGLITWGVVSAVKKRHERKKAELNADYDQREEDAYNQHLDDIQSLEDVFAERERLREEGYVWQVCSVTTTPKTSSCSYDFNTYSGNEVCTTRCLKNAQGLETMHQTNCSSGFIPSNCFNTNPTVAGYNDGYDDGYNDGYNVGYDRAYDSAYRTAYDNAYSQAYYTGYNDGYNSGFDSGWNSGYDAGYSAGSSKMMSKSLNEIDDRELGFQKGYSAGYAYALQLKTGF